MSTLKKAQIIFLALVVLVSGMGSANYAAPLAPCTQYHKLRKGENLAKVADKYNLSVDEVMALNDMPVAWLTFVGQKLCVARMENRRGPNILILTVARDQSITFKVRVGVKNAKADVYIGKFASGDVSGTKVGTFDTGPTGTFQATVNIPDGLKGVDKLDLRVRLQASKRNARSTWFYNMTSGPNGYRDIPSIVVRSVVRNQRVDVTMYNLPPNVQFKVVMAVQNNSSAHKLFDVGNLSTGVGGTMNASFTIPAGLKDVNKILLSLQDATSGCFGYGAFVNRTAP